MLLLMRDDLTAIPAIITLSLRLLGDHREPGHRRRDHRSAGRLGPGGYCARRSAWPATMTVEPSWPATPSGSGRWPTRSQTTSAAMITAAMTRFR